jgi:tRNA(Ile)-lysidine synthase
LGEARRYRKLLFAEQKRISIRRDDEDLKYNRVRIRKVLLPLLKDFNPKIVETLWQTARLLREDALALDAVTERSGDVAEKPGSWNFERGIDEDQRPKTEDQIVNLPLKDLKDVFPSVRRTVLRDWLKENRGNLRRLELKHIEAVEKLIFSRKSGRTIELPGGEIVSKKNGKLHFQKTKVEK